MEFSHVKTFAKNSKNLCEGIKEYAQNAINERHGKEAFVAHSKEECNKLINKQFAEDVAREAGVELPNLDDKTEVQRFCMNPMVKHFALVTRDIMIDAILPSFIDNGVLPLIADVKYADLGDSLKFTLKSNEALLVSKAGRRQKHTVPQKTFRSDVTLTGENHILTISTTLFEIMTGQSYIAEEVMKMAEAIERTMCEEAFDAFANVATTLDANLQVANYTEDALITLCEKVGAWNGGRKPIIMGTPKALKGVLPQNGNYRYFLEDSYVRLGHLAQFDGYDLLPIEQRANVGSTTYGLKFDDDKLYIVSPATDKIVKIGVFGGTFSYTDGNHDSANNAIDTTCQKDWEVVVATNAVMGCVESLEEATE